MRQARRVDIPPRSQADISHTKCHGQRQLVILYCIDITGAHISPMDTLDDAPRARGNSFSDFMSTVPHYERMLILFARSL